jgi:hypothetical protein
MRLHEDELDQLANDLRALRGAPSPAFAADLDARAAGGFPRGRRLPSLPKLTPRQMLAPAAAMATLVVVVGVAISQVGGGGTETATPTQVPQGEPAPGASAQSEAGAGGASVVAPQADALRESAPGSAPVAPGKRQVVQRADLQLATEPDDVRNVADGVVRVTDRYRGYVVSSSVTSGPGAPPPKGGPVPLTGLQQASGTFLLKFPLQHLQAALAELSGLAHVQSRTEHTQDITGHVNSAQDRVSALEQQRDRLLRKLSEATTIDEQQTLRARLAIVQHQLTAARADLAHVEHRIQYVPVSVEVFGQKGIGGGGAWGFGDALHDAGRVLTVAAGVLVISAAVLVPLALLVLLAWLTAREVAKRRRERALDQTI